MASVDAHELGGKIPPGAGAADARSAIAGDAEMSTRLASRRTIAHTGCLAGHRSQQTGEQAVLRDGSHVLIRPVCHDDAVLLADGFDRLGVQSRWFRFLRTKNYLSPSELRYATDIDHHDHEALGALTPDNGRGLGVARYIRAAADPQAAEIAVTIVDEWQGRGLASELLTRLTGRALEEGIRRFTALVAADNHAVIALLRSLPGELVLVGHYHGALEYEIDLGWPQGGGVADFRPGVRDGVSRAALSLMSIQDAVMSAVGVHRGVSAADRLCEACVELLSVDAAAISLVFDDANTGTLGVSGDLARVFDELQFTLGEGPCQDSVAARAPVLVTNLAADVDTGRWPAYGPAMLAHDIGGVYAVPVLVAGEYLGALNLFRRHPGQLDGDDLAGALVVAELAEMPLLDLLAEDLQAATADPDSWAWNELNMITRGEVSQATGMLVAQLEIAPAEALVRLRAHAYAAGQSATEVARDILERRLRLERR